MNSMKKRILTIFIAMVAAFSAISCVGKLDVVQKGVIDANNMWKSEDDFTAGMYGCYYSFRAAYKVNLTYWGDFRSGVIGKGLGSFNAANHVENKLNSSEGKGTNWESLYKCINDCNVTLKHLHDIKWSDEDLRRKIEANCHFLRAYCYFTIVRVWGDAPVMLDGIESTSQKDITPSREPASRLYELVAEEIALAAELMPETGEDRTVASKGALNMLEAEYWLWLYRVRRAGTEALDKAEKAVDAVLEDPMYELLGSYADVFDVKKELNREIILALPFTKITEEVTTFYDDYLIPISKYGDADYYKDNEFVKVGSQDQWYSFSEAFQNFLYENPSDSRSRVNFMKFTVPETGHTYSWINKFPGEWEDGVRYFTSDIPLYRFSEALLFKAEIENEKGGDALTWLNLVAARAYGSAIYPAMDYDAMNEAIFNERLKEFAAEGKSWWDYIRMGYVFTKIPSLVGRQNETNILLWPVAADCFSDNPNIVQTLGYN